MSAVITSSRRSKSETRAAGKDVAVVSVAGTGRMQTLMVGALALSGMAALVYQVVWVRQLGLVVGVEVYSITVALSAFFAGLAAGGAIFGRMADDSQRPMRLYAILEGLIALSAVMVTMLLGHAAALFVWLGEHAGVAAWLLPFVLVGVPALLMGGTLPVAVRALRATSVDAARAGGALYAANTAGAIAGALAASFCLLPWFGVRGSALVAACLNVMAGGLAWKLGDREEARAVEDVEAAEVAVPVASRMALALYGVAGGVALGYELVWTQAIGQFVSTRAFAFSIVLAVYLVGLAAGGWIGSRMASRVRDAWGWFAVLIAGAGLVAVLEFAVMGRWMVQAQFVVASAVLQATGSQAARMYASFAVAGVMMVLLPTVLLGAAFPMALRMVVGGKQVGRGVGAVVALNTLGGVVGTLLTGFFLIPAVGLVRTLALLAIGGVAVGLVAVFSRANVSGAMRWTTVAAAAGVVVAALLTPVDRLAKLLLTTRGGGALVFYEEGRGATVAVAQQRARDNVFRRLFVQGVSNSGDTMPSMRYMRLQAMLPLMLHRGEPKSVMVIGFGTGITAGETLRYPGLERRVCAELLPAVVRSGEMFPENYRAWSDAKLQIRVRDGRQELMRSAETYDVITLEPPPPAAQGVANLYSTDFYELAKRRLAPNGLLAQWLPIATQNVDETRGLVKSFLDAFPDATLWTSEMHEMLLVGSMSPIRANAKTIAERFSPETVVTSLKAVGFDSPAAVLATWVTGRNGLERFASGAKAVTDDRPRIEYGPWVRPDELARVLPEMLALKAEIPLDGADSDLLTAVEQRRATLMDFYAAGVAAYGGDEAAWERSISRVNAAEPENPYYRWISGRD